MKIVIDIPEENYERMKFMWKMGSLNPYLKSIAIGTPLPKGHGRLIEANEELFQAIRKYCGKNAACEVFDNAPTIIDADKEGTDE